MLHICPPYLYKYKPLQEEVDLKRALEIIRTHTIYTSPVKSLNDPMEGKGVIPSSIGGGHAGISLPISVERIPSSLIHDIGHCRVLSLSETPVSPPMWAYYGSNYSGICFQMGILPFDVEPVRYSPMSYKVDGVRIDSKSGNSITRARLLVKHSDWSHELEWRAIFDSEQEMCHASLGNHNPSAVIIGHKCATDSSAQIVTACNKAGIPVYQTYLADWNYRIRIIPFGFKPEMAGDSLYKQVYTECMQRNIPMCYEW